MIDLLFVEKLKQAVLYPNDKYYFSEEYCTQIYKLLDDLKKEKDETICTDALDAAIAWSVFYNRQFIILKIIKTDYNFKSSKYEPLLRLYVQDFKNFEIMFYDSIKNKDYDSVRKLVLFVRAISVKYTGQVIFEKMYRLVIKDLSMVEIFLNWHIYPNQNVLLALIRSGFITNTLYILENHKIVITNDLVLFTLYKLAIVKFKSHRLFTALYKLYALPKEMDVYEVLKYNHEWFNPGKLNLDKKSTIVKDNKNKS